MHTTRAMFFNFSLGPVTTLRSAPHVSISLKRALAISSEVTDSLFGSVTVESVEGSAKLKVRADDAIMSTKPLRWFEVCVSTAAMMIDDFSIVVGN